MLAASLGIGLLLKSLIGVVFPDRRGAPLSVAHAPVVFGAEPGSGFIPSAGLLIVILLIAAPWHILATLRNPPYFSFTLHSGPGEYHGFLWFFFINEQLLRFLNLRYPRDYNTVPRLYFWLFHLVVAVSLERLSSRGRASFPSSPIDRAGRTRLLALCWTALCWFSSRSPRRRNTTRCLAILPSRYC